MAVAYQAPGRSEKSHFDGVWDTVLSCPNTSGALGYSFRFSSTVRDGSLHAEKGTKGQPGWLEINGKIKSDGAATLYADGLVGAADYAVGHRPAGTEFGYHIDTRFEADQGKGKRVEGRACEVTFAKAR
jgi:hypothetical protein